MVSFVMVICVGAFLCFFLHKFPSCSEYKADYLLDKLSEYLCSGGQECRTPLPPGTYGGGKPIEGKVPPIPGILATLVASGTYYGEATVNKPDGVMACLYFRVKVEA